MTVEEVEKIDAALAVLDKHGYTEAAAALRAVAEREFAAVAEYLRSLA